MLRFLTASITAATLVTCLAGNASANPELARAWAEKAGALKVLLETEGSLTPSIETQKGLMQFSRIAIRLSKSDEEGYPVPKDLGCIFRGMAEETNNQLDILDKAEDETARQTAHDRLIYMLDDAVIVGESAAIAFETGEGGDQDNPIQQTCHGVSGVPERLK